MPPSGGNTSTTTNNQQPWQGQQAPLLYGFGQARDLYNSSSPSYYPGSTVANQGPATKAFQQGATALGVNGDSTVNAAGGYLDNVLGGQYTNGGPSNPFSQQLTKSISDSVLPNVAAQFSLAGRTGSPDEAGTMTTALTNALAPYQFGNYQQERQNQQSAAGMAPGQGQANAAPLGLLQQAGQSQDTQAQNVTNAGVNQWNYNQNLAANKLAQYMQLIQGNYGGTGTSTTTQPSGGPLGALGGLLGAVL